MRSGRARMRAFGAGLLAVSTSIGIAACDAKPRVERTGSLLWRQCGPIQCTTLSVPLDRTRPDGREIRLALARRPADGRRAGVLLTNPGGPGGSGVELVQHADDVFSAAVRDRFDIVSWDPRGAGARTRVDCGDELDYFYAVNRSDASAATLRANVAAAERFVAGCRRASRGLLPFLSSRASAADMDAIRAAMGVRTVSYIGFSYGTYLGALYADRYPRRVRAMVLDGAIDPALPADRATIRQAAGFDRALAAFLAWCQDDAKCDFARHGDPVTAFPKLMSSLTHETLPGELNGEERTLGPGEADIGIATALYAGRTRAGWEALGAALRDAAQGDGTGLLALSDVYTGRRPGGDYDETTDAFYTIGCLDAPAPRDVDAVRRLAVRAVRAAPVFGASNVWLGLPCTFWPAAPDGTVAPIHAAGAPPIVVLGTTDDPATPFSSARALARELDRGRLLTFVGEGHTAYGRGSRCVDERVDDYLISLRLFPEGTRCR